MDEPVNTWRHGDASAHAEGCSVSAHWVDQIVVLSVAGAVDMLTAPLLTDAIRATAAQFAVGIIVDLSAVEFLASAGMRVLVNAHSEVTPALRFGVVADGPATSRPLTLLRLDELMALYPTLDEALHDVTDG
jgi:anti-sigma B factor antagonist